MTQKAKNAQVVTEVVLFGLDESGKPKAALFSNGQADLAVKAATQLKLQVLTVNDDKIAELASRLPRGRVHENGKGFIPVIRRDLYGKLLEASGQVSASQTAANTGQRLTTGPIATLPQGWQQIAVGHMVIIQEDDPRDGWWDAIVQAVTADMLSLRWCINPRDRAVARNRFSVGLMYSDLNSPAAQSGSAQPKPSTAPKNGNHKKTGEGSPTTTVYPRSWPDIAPDHLVLAREDGPLGQWWEAIVVSQQDEAFTLRWRDYADLPLIVRDRQALALLHPSDK